MTCFRKALAFCVLPGALVAASTVIPDIFLSYIDAGNEPAGLKAIRLAGQAQAQSLADTEFEFEADLDVLLALGDVRASREPIYADLALRGRSETFLDSGWRFGADVSLAVQTGDGRRGVSRPVQGGALFEGQAVAGALTGLHGPSELDASETRLTFERAEFYLQNQWQTLRLGLGQTAADLERSEPVSALRLARLDGPGVDPSGLSLGHTDLSFASGAPTVSVQSRRIIGLRASASYSMHNHPCFQGCGPSGRALLGPRLEQIWSLGASFDRRAPSTGVRWAVGLGVEHAQADFDSVSALTVNDPWLVSLSAMREKDGISVSLRGLVGREGVLDQAYQSLSATVSYEMETWLVSAEALAANADLVESQSHSVQLSASRFVGAQGLAGIAIRYSEEDGPLDRRDGIQLLLETGLRF